MLESLATTSVQCWLTHARLVRKLHGSVYLGFKNTEYRIQNTEYFIVTLIIHVMQAKVLQAIKYITTYNT